MQSASVVISLTHDGSICSRSLAFRRSGILGQRSELIDMWMKREGKSSHTGGSGKQSRKSRRAAYHGGFSHSNSSHAHSHSHGHISKQPHPHTASVSHLHTADKSLSHTPSHTLPDHDTKKAPGLPSVLRSMDEYTYLIGRQWRYGLHLLSIFFAHSPILPYPSLYSPILPPTRYIRFGKDFYEAKTAVQPHVSRAKRSAMEVCHTKSLPPLSPYSPLSTLPPLPPYSPQSTLYTSPQMSLAKGLFGRSRAFHRSMRHFYSTTK